MSQAKMEDIIACVSAVVLFIGVLMFYGGLSGRWDYGPLGVPGEAQHYEFMVANVC